MDKLEQQIDRWMEHHLDDMVKYVMDLIRIPSIAQYEPQNRHPFGDGCAAALDFMLQLAGRLGFETRNYDYYSGSARLPGRTDRTIGVFVHLDTTPSTNMWTSRPFEPEIREDYIIGCGAEDNKGAAVAMLYMLRCLKDLEVMLEHSILIVFGCGKKSYMQDIDHFLRYEPAPDVSLIADANFPVCVGEKGSLNFELRCPVHSDRLIDFRAGVAANMVPHQAYALLNGVSMEQAEALLHRDSRCSIIPVGPYVKVATGGLGGHAAFPEGTTSAIPVLARILLESGLADEGCAPVLRFLRDTYCTCQGEPFNLAMRDEAYGCNTHVCGLIRMNAGDLCQTVNIRYVPSLTGTQVAERACAAAAQAGMSFRMLSDTPPNALAPQLEPIASLLTFIANHVIGKSPALQPYTMGGVTYAKKLPNAIPFGPNRGDIPSPFGLGRGKGHLPDEAVRIQDLENGLKIYVLSLIRIDPLVSYR